MEQTCVEDELTLTVTRLNSESKRQKICKSLEKYKTKSAGILKSLQDHIDMLESDIVKRSQEVERKEKKLQALSLELEKIQRKIEAGETKSSDIEKELDFLRNHVRSEENQLQVLSLCLGKIEEKIKIQTDALEEKEKEIKAAETEAGDKRTELGLLRNQIELQRSELEEKTQRIKDAEIEAGVKEKVLNSLRNQIKSEEKTLIKVRESVVNTQNELEMKKKEIRQTSTVVVKHEQQLVAVETEEFIGDPFMRYKISSASIGYHEVSNILRAKCNPADYVLELVEGEVRDAHQRKESGLRELVVENLVLFFEEIADIGVLDKPHLQLKATSVANLWKCLIRTEAPRSSIEALAFLLFIVAYEIKSLINKEETALLVTSVFHYRQGPKLFHSLGLEPKIPECVLGLINDRHYIPAARLVCLFKLKDFSAQNLLMKEVINLKRSALGKVDNKDVGRLSAIIELAADYKLDIDLSADLIAKLVFQRESSTPHVLYCSVEAPRQSANGGSSGSRVGLQVPKREIESFMIPSDNGSDRLAVPLAFVRKGVRSGRAVRKYEKKTKEEEVGKSHYWKQRVFE
ncbi:FRIGIDA-like protein 5 [Capsella rubella]|uniref:FRIGIDA-like protein 5 n=1 Tax=Capsella rubella TaxID=81985 RepID=UPI000CD5AD22|nr:FRIGIDA-like protein 5 [Capsella rubella]